jgi:hypothetical protein
MDTLKARFAKKRTLPKEGPRLLGGELSLLPTILSLIPVYREITANFNFSYGASTRESAAQSLLNRNLQNCPFFNGHIISGNRKAAVS